MGVHVTTKGLPYLVVILMALLVQSIYIQVNARQHGEEARVMAGQSTTITLYEANMYRAQRNTYMAAIALLGMLMLREIIHFVRRCVEYEDEIARSNRRWSGPMALCKMRSIFPRPARKPPEKLHSAKEDIKAGAKHAAR